MLTVFTSAIGSQSAASGVDGSVLDLTQRPVRGARVRLITMDGVMADTRVTDDNGRFGFRDIAPGRYDLQVTKAGWLDAIFGATQPEQPGVRLHLESTRPLHNLAIVMMRGSVIAGTVRDGSGFPVPNIMVNALQFVDRNGQLTLARRAMATTSAAGQFRAFGLPPGDYIVFSASPAAATSAGRTGIRLLTPDAVELALAGRTSSTTNQVPALPARVDFVPIFYQDAADVTHAEIVRLGREEERAGVDMVIRPVPIATVLGTVEPPPGIGVTRFQLRLLPASARYDELTALIPMDAPVRNGKFVIPAVPAGTYRLSVLGMGESPVPLETNSTPHIAGYALEEIHVNGRDVEVRVELRPPFSLRGTVVLDGAEPAPARGTLEAILETVEGKVIAKRPVGTATDAVTINLPTVPPGIYRFTLRVSKGERWTVVSARLGDRDVLNEPFDLTSDRNDLTVGLTDRPTGLSGQLDDRTGPLGDSYVIAFPDDPLLWTATTRRIQMARPDTDGVFDFPNLAPGQYFVAAANDWNEWRSPTVLHQLALRARRVNVLPGQKTVVNVTLLR